jgi:hypothetical protein
MFNQSGHIIVKNNPTYDSTELKAKITIMKIFSLASEAKHHILGTISSGTYIMKGLNRIF